MRQLSSTSYAHPASRAPGATYGARGSGAPPAADGGCGLLPGGRAASPPPSQPDAHDATVPIDGAACEADGAAPPPLAVLALALPNEFLRTSRPNELARLSFVPEPGAGVAAVAGVGCRVRVAGPLAAPPARTSRPKELARLSFLPEPDAGAAASAGVSCSARFAGSFAAPPARTSRPKELARVSLVPDAGAAASAGVSCSVRVAGTLGPPPSRPAPFRRLSGLLRGVTVSGSDARSRALRRQRRRAASAQREASRSLWSSESSSREHCSSCAVRSASAAAAAAFGSGSLSVAGSSAASWPDSSHTSCSRARLAESVGRGAGSTGHCRQRCTSRMQA